jgi:hypothetical protein
MTAQTQTSHPALTKCQALRTSQILSKDEEGLSLFPLYLWQSSEMAFVRPHKQQMAESSVPVTTFLTAMAGRIMAPKIFTSLSPESANRSPYMADGFHRCD